MEEGRGLKVLKSKSPKVPGSKGPMVLTDSNAEILNGDTDDDGLGAATEPHYVPMSSHVLVRPLATRGQAQEPNSLIIPVKTCFH